MPLQIDVTVTKYGVPLPEAFALVTDYSLAPTGGTMTVTMWASKAAYEAGYEPGDVTTIPVPPLSSIVPLLEQLAIPTMQAASGVGSVTQV